MGVLFDLTGQRYGKLIVLRREGTIKTNSGTIPTWLCKCDCGQERIARGYNLRNGKIKSCGCEHLCKAPQIGDVFGRLQIIKFLYSVNENRMWLCRCSCGTEVIKSTTALKTKKVKSCGCLKKDIQSDKTLCEIKSRKIMDGLYKGTNILLLNDNIRSTNTSGARGVSYVRNNNKWHASIGFQGKNINLGYYDKIEDAIKARKKGEEEYYYAIIEEYSSIQKLLGGNFS